MANVMYQINYEPAMRISLAKGNSKLGKGVYALNLMPGDKPLSTKDKGQLTNVRGTCSGCCDGCENYCDSNNHSGYFFIDFYTLFS